MHVEEVMKCECSWFLCQLLTPCALLSKDTAQELEAAAKLMTEKSEFEPDEVALLFSKAKWLEEELNILGQSIGSRSQVLQTYVAFLKSSEEVRYQCAGKVASHLHQQGGFCPSSCFLWGWKPREVILCPPPQGLYSLIGPSFTKASYKH